MKTVPHSIGERQKLRYLDTFSGIGGFALPLSELGHECIGFSEIDKYASAIYARHFHSHHPYGDITKLDAASLPNFDLLVGGFPCQAFSVAGKRLGFADTRGTLFFDLARILQAKKPRYFVFENVKGLLSHESGQTFRTIISALAELGYDVQWQVLNSKNHGVPQNRERVYIVGHTRGTPRPEVFPIGSCNSIADERDAGEIASAVTASYADQNKRGSHIVGVVDHGSLRITEDRAQCIDANYWKGPDNHGARTVIARWQNKKQGVVLDDIAPALRASGGTDIRKRPCVMKRIAGWTETDRRVFAFQGDAKRSTVQEHVYHKHNDCTDTLATRHAPKIIDGVSIRRLTPIECERLQGFPDNWTAYGGYQTDPDTGLPLIKQMSDTQRYKCLGNAVTVNVVREIVKRLK